MRKIYKVIPDPSAPELALERNLGDRIQGESLIQYSPEEPFTGKVTETAEWRQFYRVGTHAFALSEEAWEHCMDMYYVVTENDVELLSVVADGLDLRVINPRQFMPPSDDHSQICDLTYANALFRIQSESPQQVFCFEGMKVQDNEFKFCYDQFGFRGLLFEEVWREN